MDSDDKKCLARRAGLLKTVGLSTWWEWNGIMHYKLPLRNQTLFAIGPIKGRNWYSLVRIFYSSDLTLYSLVVMSYSSDLTPSN